MVRSVLDGSEANVTLHKRIGATNPDSISSANKASNEVATMADLDTAALVGTTAGIFTGGVVVPTAKTAVITDADSLSVAGVKIPQALVASAFLPGALAADAANYGIFFVADRAYTVTKISEVHTTLGTDAGAVSLTVEKLTGTGAPGGGADLLGSTKINLKGTINTVQSPTLTATGASLDLAAGDRLCLKLTGTPTAVAGVAVTVILKLK